ADAVNRVGEDYALAVAIEAMVGPVCRTGPALRPRQRLPVHDEAVEEAMANGGEPDKSALPQRIIGERVGIETGGQLAALAEVNAHTARHGDAAAAKHTAHQRAQVGLVPAVVGPGLLVLVAPVAVLGAVQAGKLRQQRRYARLLHEVICLTRVEI